VEYALKERIIVALRQSGNGNDCHIGDVDIGCLAYADNLILISASVVKLQNMLDVCSTYGTSLDIRFNPTKSSLFKIRKNFSKNMPALCIDGQNIAWVNTLKYQGVYFDSGKTVKVNTSRSVRQFYASANNGHTTSANDITRLHLVETIVYLC